MHLTSLITQQTHLVSTWESNCEEKLVKTKLILFGEAVNIPHTSIGLGVGLITVFMDNNGFTSASNDLGSLGYVLIQTQEVDLGDLDADKQQLFSDLSNRVVNFEIKPNLFVKSGGIIHVAMTISTEEGGSLKDHKIEYVAEDCAGVALVTNSLTFSTNMSPLERKLADLDSSDVVSQ